MDTSITGSDPNCPSMRGSPTSPKLRSFIGVRNNHVLIAFDSWCGWIYPDLSCFFVGHSSPLPMQSWAKVAFENTRSHRSAVAHIGRSSSYRGTQKWSWLMMEIDQRLILVNGKSYQPTTCLAVAGDLQSHVWPTNVNFAITNVISVSLRLKDLVMAWSTNHGVTWIYHYYAHGVRTSMAPAREAPMDADWKRWMNPQRCLSITTNHE